MRRREVQSYIQFRQTIQKSQKVLQVVKQNLKMGVDAPHTQKLVSLMGEENFYTDNHIDFHFAAGYHLYPGELDHEYDQGKAKPV
jgi:hypothetical protein